MEGITVAVARAVIVAVVVVDDDDNDGDAVVVKVVVPSNLRNDASSDILHQRWEPIILRESQPKEECATILFNVCDYDCVSSLPYFWFVCVRFRSMSLTVRDASATPISIL